MNFYFVAMTRTTTSAIPMLLSDNARQNARIMKCATLLLLLWAIIVGRVHANTFTVSNTNDTGAGSLRQAILDANADASATAQNPHQINFSVPLGSTITVSRPFLVVTNHVSINGRGVNGLTISGGGTSRIFWLQNGSITIKDLTLANGYAKGGDGCGGGMGAGGAIFMHEGKEGGTGSLQVRLVNVTLANNQAQGGNGDLLRAGGGGMGGNGALNNFRGGGGVLGNGDRAGGSVTDANGTTPGSNGGISIFGSGGSPNANGGFGGGGGAFASGGFGGGGGSIGNGGFGGGGGAFSSTAGFGGGGGWGESTSAGFGGGNGSGGDGVTYRSGGGMGAGGAIFVASGSLYLRKVNFNNNQAIGGNNGAKGYGGGVFCI
ncbi:MAG: hypothetical protein LCH91_19465 [Bacteroidetes bacterium]|nr:hypothetical protein [Bacteroidota bacterium]